MLDAVVQHLVVHLVGIDDQAMLTGNRQNFPQHVFRIHGAGRVVRIDDDDRARMRRNLRANIIEIRQPAIVLIAQIVLRRAARQADCGRP